jgi:hypothetical protein
MGVGKMREIENSVANNHILISEWDYDRNDIDPATIYCNCNISVWWKCKKCGKLESQELDVWTSDEIGQDTWTNQEIHWFKDNEPLCDNCIREYFKKK